MDCKRTERNVLLDYIRAAACLLIVFYHYTQRFSELFDQGTDWLFRVPWGYMAVSVFFMLSGYLAVVKDESSLSLRQYTKKKVLRLFPAYWICLPITFLVTSLFVPSRAVSVGAFLFNFTMLESFVGIEPVDGAYWTLANELVFYAFIAITTVILRKRETLPVYGLIWVILLLIYQFVSNDSLVFAAIGKIIAKQYGHMFVLGMSLFYLFDQKNNSMKAMSVINIFLALVYQYIVFESGYFCYMTISGVLIGICIVLNNKSFELPVTVKKILCPLEMVAGISYPLYLIHQNTGYAIMLAEIKWVSHTEWIIIAPIVATCLAAYLIHRYVEIPIAARFRQSE